MVTIKAHLGLDSNETSRGKLFEFSYLILRYRCIGGNLLAFWGTSRVHGLHWPPLYVVDEVQHLNYSLPSSLTPQ